MTHVNRRKMIRQSNRWHGLEHLESRVLMSADTFPAPIESADASTAIVEDSLAPTEQPPESLCVQYRESDFNFASRLMEEEGIFYSFKHEDGKHTAVQNNETLTVSIIRTHSVGINETITVGAAQQVN